MQTNKKFKSSVFSLLFSDPDLLRELYSALSGTPLPPDAPVSINTLEDVLFMDFINDISFEIDGKLVVLIEHQSTINENIALRLLLYISRVYEKIIEGRNIYSKKLFKIPRPEFFVLYNGTNPYPDEKVIKLSQSFEELKSLELESRGLKSHGLKSHGLESNGLSSPRLAEKPIPALELAVRVININEGRNREIATRCKKLSEYSAFVAKARSFEKELGSRKEAIKEAVKYCQNHDILKTFLKLHAGEVLSMLFTEWKLEDAIAVAREEGRDDGIGYGMEKGREEGREEGMEEGRVNEKLEIARNLLAEGSTFEFVQKITGLDMETVKSL